MSDEAASKTVRIDLMPEANEEALSGARDVARDPLARANWSTRRRQTAVAAASRSRYDALLQSVYDAAVIATMSGRILEANGRAVEFTRYERAALCRMNFTELLEGAEESLIQHISETLDQERFALLQAYCRRRDGSSFPAEIAVSLLETDKVRLCFFIRDISLRRQTEEMLRTEHIAVQTCGSGIAIADVDGLLGYVNPAFARMIGTEIDSLLHQDIRDVLGDAEGVGKLMESALSNEQTWMGELEIEDADGETFYVQLSATCSRNTDGEARGVVFSFADITLHKQAEQELEARVEARTVDLLARIGRLEEALNKEQGD